MQNNRRINSVYMFNILYCSPAFNFTTLAPLNCPHGLPMSYICLRPFLSHVNMHMLLRGCLKLRIAAVTFALRKGCPRQARACNCLKVCIRQVCGSTLLHIIDSGIAAAGGKLGPCRHLRIPQSLAVIQTDFLQNPCDVKAMKSHHKYNGACLQ